ncbi:MAG: hypothetical protein IJ809_00355 [Clostridia bacterium]|nr:hypothetical protein [Clostridia bacterium]
MENSLETLMDAKMLLDESVDLLAGKEEIDKRWAKYRRILQRMIKDELEKIDEPSLKSNVRHHLKKFKNCFLKPKAEFRHMQMMIQLDVVTRDYLGEFEGLSEIIDIFVDGYAISYN